MPGVDLGPLVRTSLGEVQELANILGISERAAVQIIQASAAEYGVAADAAGAAGAEAAGAALGGWVVLIILVMVVAILELVAFIAHILITPLNWVPTLGRPKIGDVVYRSFTRQYDPVIAGMNAAAGAVVQHLFHNMIVWMGFSGRQAGFVTRAQVTNINVSSPSTGGSTSGTLRSQVAGLESEVHHLQQEIDSIEYRLEHPANGTATAPQVWSQIHALQRSVHALNQAMIDTQAREHTLTDRQTALEHRMATLSTQLHGISAVAVTWQDIANEVDQLGNSVANLANQTAQDLHHQERQITQLAPLGILLQPGVQGLRTLRSLEDKPCQCPEFGNVPNWLGTALAVEEFVANG